MGTEISPETTRRLSDLAVVIGEMEEVRPARTQQFFDVYDNAALPRLPAVWTEISVFEGHVTVSADPQREPLEGHLLFVNIDLMPDASTAVLVDPGHYDNNNQRVERGGVMARPILRALTDIEGQALVQDMSVLVTSSSYM